MKTNSSAFRPPSSTVRLSSAFFKWRTGALATLMLVLSSAESWAQVSITALNTAFTQNFDGMGSSATATLPTGFMIGTDWSTGATATTLAYGTTGTGVVTGTSGGGVINWANGITASATDRSLGFLNTGSFTSPQSIVYAFKNDTGQTITSLTITFDYEKSRSGSRGFDWTFYHGSTGTPSTAATAGDHSYAADANNTVISNPPLTTSKTVTITGLSIAPGDTYYVKWTFTGVDGSTNGQGIGIDNFSITAASAVPVITGAATATAFTTTYGTASAAQTFSVSGANLTANITATAPTGFEVASDGVNYGATATFTQSGGNASGTLSVRLKASAVVGGTYNSQNIVLSSTGASSVNIVTAASGNIVSPKALTITASPQSKTYGATVSLGTSAFTSSGLENSESIGSVTLSGGGTAATDATGSYTITASAATGGTFAPGNYSINYNTGTLTVNQKALTITANDVTKAFGATLTGGAGSTAFTSIGLENSETIGTVTIAYGAGAASGDAVGSYPGQINPSAATGGTFTAANYSITYIPGDITVTADPTITLNGTLTAVDSTYGTPSPTPTSFTVSGIFLTGDLTVTPPAGFEVSTNIGSDYSTTLTLAPTIETLDETTVYVRLPATATVAGSPYSGDVAVTGGSAPDKTIATVSSTVTPKALTISGLTGSNKVYDRTLTAGFTGTPTLVGIVSGDESDVSLAGTPVATFATFTVGTAKPITVTGYTLSGAAAGNYSVTQPTGLTGDITPLALAVTGATVTSKVYSGTTVATITGASVAAGVISPDVVSVSGGGTFADANVGTGIAVTAALTLGGADAGNYSVIQPTGLTGNITTKALTITGLTGANKVYNGLTTAIFTGTAAYSGLVNAETFTVSGTPSASFATAAVGTGKAITITGYTAPTANYSLTQPALTANITTAPLTITGLTGNNKVYDRNTTASLSGTPAYVGLVNGETFSVSGTPTATFATVAAGTAKPITVTGYTAPANYSVTQPSGLTGDITQKPLTVTGATVTSRAYNGTTAATITGATLVGVISPDVVTIATSTGTFADANVGTGIAVTAGLTLSGAAAANYSLTQPTGLTGNITKANQTITFAALPDKLTTDAPFALTGTSDSGLTVSYASSVPTVATVSGSTVTIVGLGTTTITASQAGNGNYNAATAVLRTLTVNAPIVAAWDFFGESSPATSSADVFNANLDSSSLITRGAGAASSSAGNSFRTTGFQNNGISTANTDYFQTTLSVASGFRLSLTTIDAQFNGTDTFYTSPGVTSQFAYSLDGTTFTLIGSPVTSTSLTMAQVSLAGVSALQNVPPSTTVTIRYYASGQTATGGWGFNSPSAGIYGLRFGGAVVANNPPVALNVTSNCTPGLSLVIQITGAGGIATDADGDTLSVTTAGFSSAGTNLVFTSGSDAYIYYKNTNAAAATDSFTYTVTDAFGGSDTKTITVNIAGPNSISLNKLSGPDAIGDGTVRLKFLTIPGYAYALEWTTNLTPTIIWTPLVTNTASTNGLIIYTNTPTVGPDYYRTRWVP